MMAFQNYIVRFQWAVTPLNHGYLQTFSGHISLPVLEALCTSVLDNFMVFSVKIYWKIVKKGKYIFTKCLLIFINAFQNEFFSVCYDIYYDIFGDVGLT